MMHVLPPRLSFHTEEEGLLAVLRTLMVRGCAVPSEPMTWPVHLIHLNNPGAHAFVWVSVFMEFQEFPVAEHQGRWCLSVAHTTPMCMGPPLWTAEVSGLHMVETGRLTSLLEPRGARKVALHVVTGVGTSVYTLPVEAIGVTWLLL